MSDEEDIIASIDSVGGGFLWDSTIKLTKARSLESLPDLKVAKVAYEMIAYSRGLLIVTEKPNQIVFVDNNWQQKTLFEFEYEDFGLRIVSIINAERSNIVVGGNSGYVYFFEIDTSTHELTLNEIKRGYHTLRVVSVASSVSGDFVVTGADDSLAIVWNMSTLENLWTLRFEAMSPVWAATFIDLDGPESHVMTGHENGFICLWSSGAVSPIQATKCHNGDVFTLVVARGQVWSVSADGKITLCSVTPAGFVRERTLSMGATVSSIAFDDSLAYIGVRAKGLVVYDLEHDRELAVVKHKQVVQTVVILKADACDASVFRLKFVD